MSDEANSLVEEEINIYKNHLLNLFRTFLILRNLAFNGITILNNETETKNVYEAFDKTAVTIRQYPLFFYPTKKLIFLLEEWCNKLNKYVPAASNVYDANLLNVDDNFLQIYTIKDEILEHFTYRENVSQGNDKRREYYQKIRPEFDSISIFYNNAIDAIKLEKEIKDIRSQWVTVLEDSTKLKELINEFQEKFTSFNVFEEKQFNEKTKQIYTEIYNSEYKLANNYRKYAIAVFLSIGAVAIICFVLPLIIGIINYFKINEFKSPEPNSFFFIKSVFMLLLTAPGWYFARESAKHRQVAYKAKIISSELSALPYYLADLEEKDRHEMRMKMADKFFGQELYNDKKSDSSNVSEQTKATTEAIKTINALLSKSSKPTDAP
ncbi:hypothetical protein V7G70_17755 [Acinetobacter pittii]|uniref:hypothetical protein n=1 Tax=Acinetobacter pittii TaxID=48296 RepID=UPI002FF2DB25